MSWCLSMKSGGHVVFHQLLLRAFQNDKKDAGGGEVRIMLLTPPQC